MKEIFYIFCYNMTKYLKVATNKNLIFFSCFEESLGDRESFKFRIILFLSKALRF